MTKSRNSWNVAFRSWFIISIYTYLRRKNPTQKCGILLFKKRLFKTNVSYQSMKWRGVNGTLKLCGSAKKSSWGSKICAPPPLAHLCSLIHLLSNPYSLLEWFHCSNRSSISGGSGVQYLIAGDTFPDVRLFSKIAFIFYFGAWCKTRSAAFYFLFIFVTPSPPRQKAVWSNFTTFRLEMIILYTYLTLSLFDAIPTRPSSL